MSAPNVTYMRCQRVENALESDANVRRLLGPKEHTIYKGDNTPVKFCEEVLAIAQAIKDRSLETNDLTQREILRIAMPLIYAREDGEPLPKFVPDTLVSVPAAKPKAVAKPKTKSKIKAAAKPKAAVKPKPKARPKVKAAAKVEANNGPAMAPARYEAPQAELGQSRVEVKKIFEATEEAKPGTLPKTPLPYVWAVTINTLLLSCLQLLDVNAMKESSYYKRIEELAHEMDKLTVIPRPTHAKENPNSASWSAVSAP